MSLPRIVRSAGDVGLSVGDAGECMAEGSNRSATLSIKNCSVPHVQHSIVLTLIAGCYYHTSNGLLLLIVTN